jgi:hypothetical protein
LWCARITFRNNCSDKSKIRVSGSALLVPSDDGKRVSVRSTLRLPGNGAALREIAQMGATGNSEMNASGQNQELTPFLTIEVEGP